MKWLRNKKTKIGILLTLIFAILSIYVEANWVDICRYISIALICYGYNDKKEREMKWKRVDKK